MIGPKKKPSLKPGDYHLVVNDISEKAKLYKHDGTLVWEDNCLARGQYGETQWKTPRSDTPPGLYKLGAVYEDHLSLGDHPACSRTLLAYGWASIDMVDLEGNEDGSGRAGIMLHGGGSGCGWPGAWDRCQHLIPTLGCVRMYNHRAEELAELTKKLRRTGNTVYVSVYQEG